jgi:hypothetical protein
MLLELLLLVHDFVLAMLLLVLLMMFPWEILIIFLMIALILFLELIFHGMFLRGTQRLYFWTKFCILLTLMISWVHLCVSKSWVPKYLPTNPLGSKTQTSLSLSLVTFRMEIFGWRTWALMISVFCLEWLWYGWFPISLFMPSRTHVVMWHLHVLCEHSHTLSLTLTYSVESVHVLTWLS